MANKWKVEFWPFSAELFSGIMNGLATLLPTGGATKGSKVWMDRTFWMSTNYQSRASQEPNSHTGRRAKSRPDFIWTSILQRGKNPPMPLSHIKCLHPSAANISRPRSAPGATGGSTKDIGSAEVFLNLCSERGKNNIPEGLTSLS